MGNPEGQGCIGVAASGIDCLLPSVGAKNATMVDNNKDIKGEVGLVDEILNPKGAVVGSIRVDAVMENGNRPMTTSQTPFRLTQDVESEVKWLIIANSPNPEYLFMNPIRPGYYVFVMSVMNGNHSMLLTVDYTDLQAPVFYLTDQVKDRTNGNKDTKEITGGSLNGWLLQYNKETYYRPSWGITSPQATINYLWLIQKI